MSHDIWISKVQNQMAPSSTFVGYHCLTDSCPHMARISCASSHASTSSYWNQWLLDEICSALHNLHLWISHLFHLLIPISMNMPIFFEAVFWFPNARYCALGTISAETNYVNVGISYSNQAEFSKRSYLYLFISHCLSLSLSVERKPLECICIAIGRLV